MLLQTVPSDPLGVLNASLRSLALIAGLTGRFPTQARNCFGVGSGSRGMPRRLRLPTPAPLLSTIPTDSCKRMVPPCR